MYIPSGWGDFWTASFTMGWSYFGRILVYKSGKQVGIGVTAVIGVVPIENPRWGGIFPSRTGIALRPVSLRCFLAGLKGFAMGFHFAGDGPSFNGTLPFLTLISWARPPCQQFLAYISERWQALPSQPCIRIGCVVPIFPLVSVIEIAPKTVGVSSVLYTWHAPARFKAVAALNQTTEAKPIFVGVNLGSSLSIFRVGRFVYLLIRWWKRGGDIKVELVGMNGKAKKSGRDKVKVEEMPKQTRKEGLGTDTEQVKLWFIIRVFCAACASKQEIIATNSPWRQFFCSHWLSPYPLRVRCWEGQLADTTIHS